MSISTVNDFGVDGGGDFITNNTLRHEDNVSFSAKLVEVATRELNGVADLFARNLVVPLGSDGVTLSMYERVSNMTRASVDMDAETDGQKDKVTFTERGVPVPVFHKEFAIGFRQLSASNKNGTPLSTTQLVVATRTVAEEIEDSLFNGVPKLAFDDNNLYGYTTHPDRNTLVLTGGGWAVSAGSKILADTERMLDVLYNDNMRGPYILYVAKNIWTKLLGDYSENKGERTYLERIMAYHGVEAVKASSSLAANQVVMVQMTDDVVDIALGQDIRRVEFMANKFKTTYSVYGIMAARVKSDMEGQCGVVHGTL